MDDILSGILSFKETFFTILFFVALYFVVNWLLNRQGKGKSDGQIIRSLIIFGIVMIGFISIILALPMPESLRGQITSLMGIVISAVLALSSATFIGNGLAGIMLRSINNFKPGDFITVGDHFGRISERGLFHTEIQNENRDLTTLPNMYLATNPVKVKRSSGTMVSSEVSLGYDVNRELIAKALKEAAQSVDLVDSFVTITSLGDFSIVYKVQGLLKDVKMLISKRSRLNAAVIDELHKAGIEIVSPTFMNQRQVGDTVFIPKRFRGSAEDAELKEGEAEGIIFDKAEEAETIEGIKEKMDEVQQKIKGLETELKGSKEEGTKEEIGPLIKRWKEVYTRLQNKLEIKSGQLDK